jgi:hypothetical protein
MITNTFTKLISGTDHSFYPLRLHRPHGSSICWRLHCDEPSRLALDTTYCGHHVCFGSRFERILAPRVLRSSYFDKQSKEAATADEELGYPFEAGRDRSQSEGRTPPLLFTASSYADGRANRITHEVCASQTLSLYLLACEVLTIEP